MPSSMSSSAKIKDLAVKSRVAPRPVAKLVKKDSVVPVMATNDNLDTFAAGDSVIYPSHGLGVVENIEILNIGGQEIQFYCLYFKDSKLRLKVPMNKAATSGMRRICSTSKIDTALETLKGKARVKRTMWSRRAQEYEAKINSGDPVSIAEVLRDLRRNTEEQSFSERELYQTALERLAKEIAAVQDIDQASAASKVETLLKKAA